MAEQEEHLKALLDQGKLEEAAAACRLWLSEHPSVTQYNEWATTLAHILAWQNKTEEALSVYADLLVVLEEAEVNTDLLQATTVNNLGRLLLASDPAKAITLFSRAIEIYTAVFQQDLAYGFHLANSRMARAEGYNNQQKFALAKQDLKAALGLYQEQDLSQTSEMTALARYQLGGVYMEEFNAYDARIQYSKAQEIYRSLCAKDRQRYLPMLGACLNNLAMAERDAEQPEKALKGYQEVEAVYKELSAAAPERYLPYLAQTYSGMGILAAEQLRDIPRALEFNEKALQVYGNLCELEPERYTHYLATAHHNNGVYHAEALDWKASEAALDKALALRLTLEEKAPGHFQADLASTALNLLENYREQLEHSGDFIFKEKAIGLVRTAHEWLQAQPDTPLMGTMRSELAQLVAYFQELDPADVAIRAALREVRKWEEEVDGTLDVSEKKVFQELALSRLREVTRAYPGRPNALRALQLALNNMAWLEICSNAPEAATRLLDEAEALEIPLMALTCNRAHCLLLQGQRDAANLLYRELWPKRHYGGKTFGQLLHKDLWKLIQYGVLAPDQLPAADRAASRPHQV